MRSRRGGRGHEGQTALAFDAGADPFVSAPDLLSQLGADTAPPPPPPPPRGPSTDGWEDTAPEDHSLLDPETVRSHLGADLDGMLDLQSWSSDPNTEEMFRSAAEQARLVVERERQQREPRRRLLRERLAEVPDPPPYAGLHRATEKELEWVARSYLYNGRTEAVCGGFVAHETLPLTIGQAGICAVGYSGRHDQWFQRLYRKEVVIDAGDPVAEVEALLEQRDQLRRPGTPSRLEQLNLLARRGIVSFMERRVMVSCCPDRWRLGFGVPAPLDLLTGMGSMQLLERSLELLRHLILDDPRWLFVSRTTHEPGMALLGDALEPFEFAVVMRLRLQDQTAIGRYPSAYQRRVDAFIDDVGRHLVLGIYRAGHLSPPRFFVAHDQEVMKAALIAMADAVSVQPQGYPALVQIARGACRAALGGSDFEGMVQQAYREAGAPEWIFRGER